MIIAAYILILTAYFCLEGLREFKFYVINHAADFAARVADVDRKAINALLSGVFIVLASLYLLSLLGVPTFSKVFWLSLGVQIFTALSLRWLCLDGVLNLKRGLGFWYAGNSGRSITDRILYPIPILTRAALKITLVLTSLIALFWVLKSA